MPFRADLTWEDAIRVAQVHTRTLLREINAGEEAYLDMLDAQNGATVLAWTRALYELPDTGIATLTVVASTGVISCLAGANLFASHQIGQNVQLTAFTNGGNNKTTEITARTVDSITVDNTSMVDETDTNARAQQNPTQEQQDAVTALVATFAGIHDLYQAMTNNTITASDIADKLRNFA